MYNITIDKVNPRDLHKIDEFLKGMELSLDKDVEYTIAAYEGEEIVGTCSFSGRVIKCFAVKKELQGEGLSAKLITHITNVLFDRGIYDTLIFTKPSNIGIFEGLGYTVVYEVSDVVLLEGGTANVKKYVKGMFEKSSLSSGKKAGLVMNCNPFTLGHRYLIEQASKENETVVVFVVEEDRSIFPFEVRLQLVKQGTADLKNVYIIPGGNYIISSNTFPTYFLKQEDARLNAYTRLDAGIFGKYIAKEFNINRRYVGTEPYDRVTNNYNEALIEILPQYGVEVKLIERRLIEGKIISASKVRSLIKADNFSEVRNIVPSTTFDYLNSEAAKEVIKKIKEVDSSIV